MLLRWFLCSTYLVSFSQAGPQQFPISLETEVQNPNTFKDNARDKGPEIFNAVHSAMRQWGSSLKHNGMSFLPVKVPAKTQLYHGSRVKEPVTGMEWLAFEIEHAEMFARSRGRPPPGKGDRPGRPRGPGGPKDPDRGQPDGGPGLNPPPMEGDNKGYLHIYQTNRDLSKLLYIDGTSAGKTSMGTLDTTDIVLRNVTDSTAPWGDYQRAEDLCSLGLEWDVEGFIRMEAGFELILCNFTDGLDFVSAYQRPPYDQPEGYAGLYQFEYVRGVAQRYHGITAGRVQVDYSSMASAYFYPLNLTNPDETKSDLPRLVSAESEGIQRLKTHVHHSLSQSRAHGHQTIDWQGVVDMIVTRYSDRLKLLASSTSSQLEMLYEINFLLSIFIDYNSTDIPSAKESCTTHYLKSVFPITHQDYLIHEAVSSVSSKICDTLFEVRGLLLDAEKGNLSMERDAKAAVEELISVLNWSTWLECGRCGYDEVCFVAIWPWGSLEDHEHPSCLNNSEISSRGGYWNFEH